jgi:hypothetical protein
MRRVTMKLWFSLVRLTLITSDYEWSIDACVDQVDVRQTVDNDVNKLKGTTSDERVRENAAVVQVASHFRSP